MLLFFYFLLAAVFSNNILFFNETETETETAGDDPGCPHHARGKPNRVQPPVQPCIYSTSTVLL